jgi:uncharacterized protein (DUF2126 family)
VPVHAPLVFDLIDSWKERSIGRCVYHAAPPDGRVYDRRPENAAEAEGRRRERFGEVDAPSSAVTTPAAEINPSFPLTLDLRHPGPEPEISTERPVAAR